MAIDGFAIHSGTLIVSTLCIAACLLAVQAAVASADWEIPAMPAGHPRLYVRPSDLTAVRAKLDRDAFREAWSLVQASDQPVCRAFVYLLTGNEAAGREAVAGGLANLQSGHDGRPFYNHMHKAACVYDWCYPLLSDAQKQEYIAAFKQFAREDHNRGYPPDPARANPITGHDCEGFVMTNMLPAGVAIHDEFPEMYRVAATLFFERFVPACNFYYQSHMHHQGTHYNGERFVHDQATSWLFRRLGAKDVFSADQQFVSYQVLYMLRPDGQFLKMGDENDGPGTSLHKRLQGRLAGAYYRDPYLLAFSECKSFSGHQGDFYAVLDLLFLDDDAPREPLSNLPLTRYFGYPMGTMVARTGWGLGVGNRSAVVQMHVGDTYFSNHHHLDFGTFQIYYRGPLALDTGTYQGGDDSMYGTDHWRDYYQQTVAHNGLMVFDPATMAEDHGGQTGPRSETRSLESLLGDDRRLASVTGRSFGPDPMVPAYSYISGDITRAYHASKAEKVTRSMVCFNTHDSTYPCIFIVYDRVVSADPSFKKAWYLHTLQEPRVSGTTSTVVCDGEAYYGGMYGGQLVVDTLLPAEPRIDVVGGPGRECYCEATQTNYVADVTGPRARGDELGAWRIEVSPSVSARADEFLNVLTTMDWGTPGPEVQQIETDALAGACTAGQVALFNRADVRLDRVAVDLPGEGDLAVFVSGLAQGTWSIGGPGGEYAQQTVTDEGGCLYFRGRAGQCRLRRL